MKLLVGTTGFEPVPPAPKADSDRAIVEEVLQAFQGAVLAFLVTGDGKPGRRALMRILENQEKVRSRA